MNLTEKEIAIVYEFVDNGNRRKSYRKISKDKKITDTQIYQFFKRKDVKDFIKEIGSNFDNYDTVCDKKLLAIINDPCSSGKNVIAAIKEWNTLRNRIVQTIQLYQTEEIDFKNLNDENLEKLINVIKDNNNSISLE